MNRLVCLILDPSNPIAVRKAEEINDSIKHTACHLKLQLKTADTIVYTSAQPRSGVRPYMLSDDLGVVFGTLFPTANGTEAHPVVEITRESSSRIVSSHGQTLIADFWGCYIALVRDPQHGRYYVIRDCSGRLPCYYTAIEGVTVVFSDVNDLLLLRLGKLSIDWQYISAFLLDDDVRVRQSGLIGIFEVLAGECLQVSHRGVDHCVYWDPREICRRPAIEDYDAAVRAVREVTQRCINSWSLVHRRILHNLSGGLDSSIVLACLAAAPSKPAVTCINRYECNRDEDERSFARLAAAKVGVPLVEHPWSAGGVRIDRRLFDGPKLPKPTVVSILLLDSSIRRAAAAKAGADAIWTGQGGDHLFLQSITPLMPADYLKSRGLGFGLLQVFRDASTLTGDSYWAILKTTTGAYFKRRWTPANPTQGQDTFVNPDALPDRAGDYASHPWAFDANDLPKGKQFQIRTLGDLVNRPAPTAKLDIADEHHPLISQPIIELCLNVPTYLLVKGGRHRALARAAFQDIVPQEILRREGKGSSRSWINAIIAENRRTIREVLLEGYLAQKGVLNCPQLDRVLGTPRPLTAMQVFPLLACFTAELWIRSWADSSFCAAA